MIGKRLVISRVPEEQIERMLTLGTHKYFLDSDGGVQQHLSSTEYGRILGSYRHSVYCGGRFWTRPFYNILFHNRNEIIKEEKQRAQDRLGTIQSFLTTPCNMQILELGCGVGSFLYVLQEEIGIKATGWEISIDSEQISRLLWGRNAKIVSCEVVKCLETFTGTFRFDVVLAFDVIEHLRHPEVLLSLLSGLMKKGGKLILEVPCFHAPLTLDELRNYSLLYPEHHLHLFTETGLIRLLDDFEFNHKQSIIRGSRKKLLTVFERN